MLIFLSSFVVKLSIKVELSFIFLMNFMRRVKQGQKFNFWKKISKKSQKKLLNFEFLAIFLPLGLRRGHLIFAKSWNFFLKGVNTVLDWATRGPRAASVSFHDIF
jgi:hypothetical protein